MYVHNYVYVYAVRTWLGTICDWMGEQPFAATRRQHGSLNQPPLPPRPFVASIGPAEVARSSADCPWTVRVPPGQRLNLTIHFGVTTAANVAANAGGDDGFGSRDVSMPGGGI